MAFVLESLDLVSPDPLLNPPTPREPPTPPPPPVPGAEPIGEKPVDKPPEGNNPPMRNPAKPVGPAPGTPRQPTPVTQPTGSNVGADFELIDPSLDADGNPLPEGQNPGVPGTPGQPKPGTGSNVGPDGQPIDPSLDADGNPLPEGQNPGVPGTPGQPKPGTGSNVGPDGQPIDPSLDADGNPLPPGQPGGQPPGAPRKPPGLPQEKFESLKAFQTVDDLIAKLEGESIEEIGANLSEEQGAEIVAALSPAELDRLIKFIEAKMGAEGPGEPGASEQPKPGAGSNVGPDGQPIDPSLDADGNPLPEGQPGGQPPGPPRKPPGLPQEKFESLRVFNTVDDLIAKLEGENLEEIGNNISDEQGSEIISALTPEELVRLLKFIEEKTGIPLDPDPPDVVSPDPSAEPVQVVGSVTDVAGS